MSREVNLGTIESFLAKSGQRGARVLSVLGRQQGFVDAIESPLGRELLKDAVMLSDQLLDKIVKEEASDADRADYRAMMRILTSWSERVKLYNRTLLKATE